MLSLVALLYNYPSNYLTHAPNLITVLYLLTYVRYHNSMIICIYDSLNLPAELHVHKC